MRTSTLRASEECTSSVPNLVDQGFNNFISSLKVIGNPWVTYTESDFSGQEKVFEEGEYSRVERNDSFSSLELLSNDLSDPQITLHEEENYKGRSIVCTSETNLKFASFNDRASSYKVQRGAWVIFEHDDASGGQTVVRATCDVPSFGWFVGRVPYLRPLRSGKPTITAKILWDKKERQVKSVQIDSIHKWFKPWRS